jgi:pimeloyl-ACP methyl ester carboxylesterase
MIVTPIVPKPEPGAPRTRIDPAYFDDAPAELLDPTSSFGRLADSLRQTAQLRDGNLILQSVAVAVAANYLGNIPPVSQDMITAMTQLAVTGSNAFAAWSANPIALAPYLTQLGMPLLDAVPAADRIMADFHAARHAVRNPRAGIDESSLRAGLAHKWIAVSGEDDPPDFPVNVKIAQFPQFHLPINVQAPAPPSGTGTNMELRIRYIMASQNGTQIGPFIPPGDEVVLYIHGEGSRAEEALDFIPALFALAAPAGRSFTVIALDLPGCGYTTRIRNGIHDRISHLEIAPMPPTSTVLGFVETSAYPGSPILDFVENTILTFVQTLIVPQGNPITAVVGGSLGGHMALRIVASQQPWVRNVAAWSPASVEEHDFTILGISIPQRVLTDPKLAGRATEGSTLLPNGTTIETNDWRDTFFNAVWYQDTQDISDQYGPYAMLIAEALIASGFVTNIISIGLVATVALALLGLATVPPQPLMWFRDDWPPGTIVTIAGPWQIFPPPMVGITKAVYIQESLLDRQEIYTVNFRQWHWRICEEILGFKFDWLTQTPIKPLLLMVGQKDDYPFVHFYSNVQDFAGTLVGPGKALTVSDTGHSIHNERPHFLANQILDFAPAPVDAINDNLTMFFAETLQPLT